MKRNIPVGWDVEKLLEAFVHDSQDYAYVLADRSGKIIYANSGAEKILGWGESDLHQKHFCDFFIPEDQSHGVPDEELEKALKLGSVVDERWHLRNDGTHFWAVGVTTAVRGENGHVAGFLKVFRNQTLRKKTEDQIQLAQSELLQFAAMASHDLKEPLRSVASYVQLLEKTFAEKLNDETRQYFKFALEGASHMRILIDDLMAFAKVDKEQAQFELTEANAAYDAAIVNLRIAIHSSNAKVSRGVLPSLVAIPVQLQRLFQNLIGNAIKFRGDSSPVVFVSSERRGDDWVFSVQDNGIGIPENQKEKIFEPFKRVHSKHVYPGSGLGLAACRRIVNAHHGKIWLESVEGKGATFFFSIPNTQPAAEHPTAVGD